MPDPEPDLSGLADLFRPKAKHRRAKKLPVILPEAEVAALVNAASPGRDHTLLVTAQFLGLRVAELCRLQIADLDLDRRLAFVRGGKGDKDRCVPISSKLEGPLRQWLGGRPAGFVFPGAKEGKPLSVRTAQRVIKRAAVAAGIPGATAPRKVTPHKMRHAFATTLLDRGATIREVQEALGHADVGTTMIYTHVTQAKLRGAIDRL